VCVHVCCTRYVGVYGVYICACVRSLFDHPLVWLCTNLETVHTHTHAHTHTHTHTHTHISHIETSTNPLATPLYDAYLGAMRNASGTPNTNPSFSASLAAEADFEEYCELALPDVCAAHFRWAKNVCVCASVWLIGQTC
jgi:hypothetical protein